MRRCLCGSGMSEASVCSTESTLMFWSLLLYSNFNKPPSSTVYDTGFYFITFSGSVKYFQLLSRCLRVMLKGIVEIRKAYSNVRRMITASHDVYIAITDIHAIGTKRIYRTKNRHINGENLFIKNKHQIKRLQIKRASLQMLLM